MNEKRGDPTAADMPEIAEEFVQRAHAATGETLDFTTDSLIVVEKILHGFYEAKKESRQMFGLLFLAGAYIGETVQRNAGGEWKNVSEMDEEQQKNANVVSSFPIVFVFDEVFSSPIDRVMKRVEIGPEDSILTYVNVLTGQSLVQEIFLPERKKGFLSRLFGRG